MAKKSRRARRAKKKARRGIKAQARAVPVTAAKPVKAKAARGTTPVDIRQEYRYVYEDLRRLGIIAISMLALLLALSFVFR